MTKEQLKLRCYELVGDKPLVTGNRMDDAKYLYEWVSIQDMSSIKDSFEDLEKAIEGWSEEAKEKGFTFKEVEVELSPDQKISAKSLRELSQHSNLEES